MRNSIYIISTSLKEVLELFDRDGILTNLSLGDTWHPSSGFVDEKILKGKQQISEILEFDYNFEGLVSFKANLGTLKITLLSTDKNKREEYEILGTAKEIELIRNRVIEKNAYQPNQYEFSVHIDWANDKKDKNG